MQISMMARSDGIFDRGSRFLEYLTVVAIFCYLFHFCVILFYSEFIIMVPESSLMH